MLEVTAKAKEKLREALFEEQRVDLEIIFRITPIHSMPDRLGIALDTEKGGDQVVESEEGIKVLLIESHLAQKLEGMVLDYQEKPQGKGFKILKRPYIETRQGEA
jgi:Fe-S cluster assembly iron-binding protein IscA